MGNLSMAYPHETEIKELKQERDELRAEVDRLRKDLTVVQRENGTLVECIFNLQSERASQRDEALAEVEQLRSERDKLKEQIKYLLDELRSARSIDPLF